MVETHGFGIAGKKAGLTIHSCLSFTLAVLTGLTFNLGLGLGFATCLFGGTLGFLTISFLCHPPELDSAGMGM